MSEPSKYVPPKVWKWEKENGGAFASTNRPTAGPTHEKELPIGKHPLQLYSRGTPNGVKVTILLEELLAQGFDGAEYDAWSIDIGKGDQFGSGFVDVNPNSKIPALMDHSTNPPTRVFESGAIMLYLAEKFGAFLPADPADRPGSTSPGPGWRCAPPDSPGSRPRTPSCRPASRPHRASAPLRRPARGGRVGSGPGRG